MSWPPVMTYCEHCTLVKQKLDILGVSTNNVLTLISLIWVHVPDIRTSLLGLVSIVSIFIQFVCPCLCSVFLFDLKVFLGMVAWLPCISDFLRWPSYAVSSFSLIKSQEILWSDLHTSIPTAYCSYIWLLPDLPYMEGTMFILRVGVGVGVVYPCSLYHIYSWPPVVTLCASLMA